MCSTAAVVKRLHRCLLQPSPLFRTTATTPALEPRVSPCRKPLAISSQTLAATAGSAAPLQLPATTAASVPLASSCKRRPAMTSQASAATARAAAHLLEADGHHRNTSLLCARCCGGTPRLQRSCPRGSHSLTFFTSSATSTCAHMMIFPLLTYVLSLLLRATSSLHALMMSCATRPYGRV